MKRFITILTFLVATVTIAFAQAKPVVVVVPFDAKGVSQDDVDIISEVFLSEYTSTGKATVVDRSSFDKIKAQQKFESSDWSNNDKVAQLGKALNAHQIITGQISQFGSQLVCSIKLIDVNTTEIIATTTKRVANMDVLFDECMKLAKEIASKAAIPVLYPIGSKGPAGGLVYAIEGDWRWEVSDILTENKNLAAYYNYIVNGYQDWEPPTRADAELINKNLVAQGLIMSNKGLWIYDASASGGSWDPFFKYYKFQSENDSSTSVSRAVRKFNVNDTGIKDDIVGKWECNINLFDLNWKYVVPDRYSFSTFGSKLKNAVEKDFPIHITSILYPDRTCVIEYQTLTVYYRLSERYKKKNWTFDSDSVTASVSVKKSIIGTWEKKAHSSGKNLGFQYLLKDDKGQDIACFVGNHYCSSGESSIFEGTPTKFRFYHPADLYYTQYSYDGPSGFKSYETKQEIYLEYNPSVKKSPLPISQSETKKTETQKASVEKKSYAIGDTGPGGGTVFYISKDGKHYECSKDLGKGVYSTANSLCKNYNGGGFTDWRLPTEEELEDIYDNLREPGKITGNDWYWAALDADDPYYAWSIRFSDGELDFFDLDDADSHSVIAVRTFNI